MKRFLAGFMVLTMLFSSISFGTSTTPTTTATNTANTPTLKTFTLDPPKDVSSDYSMEKRHTARNLQPYIFDLKKEDFATNKWQKYVSAIYFEATDVDYHVYTIYADGLMKQSIMLNVAETEAYVAEVKAANEAIRAGSIQSPDNSFSDFYEKVYLAKWLLVDQSVLLKDAFFAENDIPTLYPDLLDKLLVEYRLYQKGSFYILMYTIYPNKEDKVVVSSAIAELDNTVGKMIKANTDLLVAAKLMEAPKVEVKKPEVVMKPVVPVKLFYVLIMNKDKTYTLKEFKSAAEAKKYLPKAQKAYGKNNVKYAETKKALDDLIKKLKLKAKKVAK